jgi:hypothetical protein
MSAERRGSGRHALDRLSSHAALPLTRDPRRPARWLTDDGRFVLYRGTQQGPWLVWINPESASAEQDQALLLRHSIQRRRFSTRLEALVALDDARRGDRAGPSPGAQRETP